MNVQTTGDDSNWKRKQVGTSMKRSFLGHRLSEELQSIFDAIPQAILLINSQSKIEYLNRNAKSLFGEENVEIDSKPWDRIFQLYLDDGITPYPDYKIPFKLALQGRTTQDEEMILRKKDESEGIWISVTSHPLTQEDGSIDGAITFIRNISYRKQIEYSREKQLKRMEALYNLSDRITSAGENIRNLSQVVTKFASEVIGDLCTIVLKDDIHSRLEIAAFFDSNPTGQTLMGKLLVNSEKFGEDEGIVGGVIKSGEPLLIPAIESEKLKAISLPTLKEYVEEVGVESILIVPITGRGGVLGAISLSRHHGGKPYKLDDQSFLTDIAFRTALAIENSRLLKSLRIEIAEKLSTEQELGFSEERFRAIFESTTLGIKVLDLDGNILQTNKSFQEMLGHPEVELFGRPFTDFLFEEDVPRALNLIQNLKSTGTLPYRFEHRAVSKDNSIIWVKTTFSPIGKANGNQKPAYIVGIVENITEQKQAEQEMKELRDRLHTSIENERLRLAQELHDNTMQLLYTVLYQVEELRPDAEPLVAEKLETVNSEIKMILDDLRNTAKELRPPTIFDFGLENAIRSYAEDFLGKNPNLNISLSLAEDHQLLPEDIRLALFRIFQQALTNIMRHAEATEVKVHFTFDAEEIQLEISDNGKGFEVPPNWIEFVRKGHYGLAGAAERVSSLGGSLKVESKPGNTTTILATVPWNKPQYAR